MIAGENHLIELLPRRDRLGLLKVCEPFELKLSRVVAERGSVTRHVYFPTEGFISLVRPVDAHMGLEVGMIGREGMLGAQLALGVTSSPLRALVQGDGHARRVEAGAFRKALADSTALRRLLHRYIYVVMSQVATSAACLRFHRIGPRVARWLLMSQDRAHADTFHMTQQFLAYMLGVRRVGVTGAASSLKRAGLIGYRRGEVTVLDRAGLEAAACDCYRDDRLAYAGLLD